MKTTCYAAGCSTSLVGEAPNTLALADGAKDKGWIYFFDSGSGLSGRCLCPAHSPPVKEAVRLLSVFGEKFTHMHLGYVAETMKKYPPAVLPEKPEAPTAITFGCEDCGSNCFRCLCRRQD